MEWKVANALSRDVERQHLNKILKEIRAAIDSSEGSAGLTEAEVREIVRSSIPSPTRPRAFTLTLEGDVTGSARITGNDTALVTTLDAAVIEEVPADGMAYWRRFGEWESVPTAISSLSTVETPGFLVLAPEENEAFTRVFEAVLDELVVINPDGLDGNVIYGLADVEDSGQGELLGIERDSKGRVTGTREVSTDDLEEGEDNLYFTEQRAQDAVGGILQDSADIVFTYDDTIPEIKAELSSDVWDAINSSSVSIIGTPSDADIIEYSTVDGGWVPKKNPRELLLDGGNF